MAPLAESLVPGPEAPVPWLTLTAFWLSAASWLATVTAAPFFPFGISALASQS